MKKQKYTRKQIQKNAVISIIVMIIVILIIFVIAHMKKIKESEPIWEEEVFGEVVITTPVPEKTEEIPPNIFDKYGLEYEYVKIPSIGISTYIPVGWEFTFQKDFFYFRCLDKEGNYRNTEIALCPIDIENFYDEREIYDAAKYIERNLRNHCIADDDSTVELIISATSNNTNFTKLTKDDKLAAYYLNPYANFADEDDPLIASRKDYAINTEFYYMNTNPDHLTFLSVVGSVGYADYVKEIGETIFKNTNRYINTSFDYDEFLKAKLEKKTFGDMFFRMIDSEYVDVSENKYTLSTNVRSLAFNCKLIISRDLIEGTIDDALDKDKMKEIWYSSNEFVDDNKYDLERKQLLKPIYRTIYTENVQMLNKNCKIIHWYVDVPINTPTKYFVNSYMPANFITYLIPDGDYVYNYTVSYTDEQEDAVYQYMNKFMTLAGFEE